MGIYLSKNVCNDFRWFLEDLIILDGFLKSWWF